MNLRLYADEVEEGDRIEWCGLWLEVKDITLKKNVRRPGRYFLVSVNGAWRSLHYFDSETIRVAQFVDVPPAGGVS